MVTDELPDDREIDELLSSLDEPTPAVDLDALIARARARPAPRGARLRWAAAVVASLGVAGAVYAAPGSPVPGWLERVGQAFGGGSGGPTGGVQLVDSGGVVLEATGPVIIELDGDSLTGYARVSLADGTVVDARARAGAARFSFEPDRLRIEHQGPDTIDIRIPRAGERIEIRVGGRSVLVRDGAGVSTSAPGDSIRGWLIELDPVGP